LVVAGCSGSEEPANRPPTADARGPSTIFIGEAARLNGASSSDPDGDVLTHRWSFTEQPVGSTATLSGGARSSFTPDVAGTYVVELVVNDGSSDSAPSMLTLITENRAPTAHAGVSRMVDVGQIVPLDGGQSTDPDGDALSYEWRLTDRPATSSAAIAQPDAVTTELSVDVRGTYDLQLVVRDGALASAPATIAILAGVQSTPPIAEAGPDQSVSVGALVQLDGTGSSDVDGDPLTFRWTLTARPPNSNATFDDDSVATPSFGADVQGNYIAELVVSDPFSSSPPDTVAITAADAPGVIGPSTFDSASVHRVGSLVTGGDRIVAVHTAGGLSGPMPENPGYVAIRPTDGRLLYAHPIAAGDWALRVLTPDPLLLDPMTGRWSAPANAIDNDREIGTPRCVGGLSHFLIHPMTGEVYYACSSDYFRGNSSIATCIGQGEFYVRGIDVDGALLCESATRYANMTHPIVGLDGQFLASRAKPGGGWWVATRLANDRLARFSITAGGVATRDGDYPDPEPTYRLSTGRGPRGQLDGEGRYHRIVTIPNVARIIRFENDFSTITVALASADDPLDSRYAQKGLVTAADGR